MEVSNHLNKRRETEKPNECRNNKLKGNIMNWYLKVLKQYADFNGRARRKEYWMFVLFNMIFATVAMILDNILGIAIEGVGYGPLYGLYGLAVLIPWISSCSKKTSRCW